MNHRILTFAVSAALGVSTLLGSEHASACALDASGIASNAQYAAFTQFAAGLGNAPASDFSASAPPGSIVGMWRFAFTAPGGGPIDWGFQTWHSDGTELTNSGGRPAKNGNFCTGVWEQRSSRVYVLNHWAIAWGLPPDFDETTLSGLVNIKERVQVDHTGNAMTGTVSLDLYAVDGTTLLAHIVDGTVSGTRITP